MEEEKYWQKPWWQAGFKTEEEWFNWWISALRKATDEAESKLNALKTERWESESQIFDFITYLCKGTRTDCDSENSLVCVDSIPDAKNWPENALVLKFLNNEGVFCNDIRIPYSHKWYEIARKTSEQIEQVLTKAKKIRRNILYPEVAEMERKLDTLASLEYDARKREEELWNQMLEKDAENENLKSQLAEKEKGVEQLKAELEIEKKYSWGIKIALGLITNVINPDENELKKYFPENTPHDVNQIIRLYEDKKITESQLAEKEKEIERIKIISKGFESGFDAWKTRAIEFQTQLAEKEKELKEFTDRVEKNYYDYDKIINEGNGLPSNFGATYDIREALVKLFGVKKRLETQLAEKVKEIGELKAENANTRSMWSDWILKGIRWEAILYHIIENIRETKSISKSGKFAEIREKVEKLAKEIGEYASQHIRKLHSK